MLLEKNTQGIEANKLVTNQAAVSDVLGEILLQFNEQAITASAGLLTNSLGSTEETARSTTSSATFTTHQLQKIDL